MQLNKNGPQQGSFGIPPQMQEAHVRAREEAEEKRKKTAPPTSAPTAAAESAAPVETSSSSTPDDQKAEETHPIKILEKLGAPFADEDFQRLLFKGYYEKELVVVNHPKEELRLRAVFRTLSGEEYDEADALLAEEAKTVEMTNEGFSARRSMIILSYGVIQLNGKPVVKPILNKDKKVDTRATAAERRKAFNALSPAVANKLVQIHGAITVAINMIINKPEEYLKNS